MRTSAVLILLLVGCEAANQVPVASKPPVFPVVKADFSPGDTVVITAERGAPICEYRWNLDRLVVLIEANDVHGGREMEKNGQVEWIQGTPMALVIRRSGKLAHEVRILEGEHAGKAVYVLTEFMEAAK